MSDRRFRFSLRTLLVVVFLTMTAAAWYGWRLRAEELHQLALRDIEGQGGWIWYDTVAGTYHVGFKENDDISCGQTRCVATPVEQYLGYFDDTDLPVLTQLRGLRSVDFAGSTVTPAAIAEFRRAHPEYEVTP